MATYEVIVLGERTIQCHYTLEVEANSFEEAETKAMAEVETGQYDYLATQDSSGDIEWEGTYIQ